MNLTPRNYPHTTGVLGLLTLILAAGALAGCESMEQKCTKQGGTVTVETELKKVNGQWRTVTEHECHDANGTELFEW